MTTVTSSSIQQRVERAQQLKPWTSWKIYRVPHNLKGAQMVGKYSNNNSNKAYVPEIVSLGPYHRGSSHLEPMEEHKARALQVTLDRTGKDIDYFLDALRGQETEARGWYQGGPTVEQLGRDEFVEMLLLDGCFMLEIIRGNEIGFNRRYYSADDPVFTQQGYIRLAVIKDMIKLENQIPLFILDRLLDLQYATQGEVASLAIRLFNSKWVTGERLKTEELNNLRSSISKCDRQLLHCLDIFRQCLVNGMIEDETTSSDTGDQLQEASRLSKLCKHLRICLPEQNDDEENGEHGHIQIGDSGKESLLLRVYRHIQKLLPCCGHAPKDHEENMIYCVSDLRESGVKFRRRKDRRPFWDIKFQSGVLQIPRIRVDESLEQVLRNLIAFEQCHSHIIHRNDAIITAYTAFMDNLINSAEDVGHLHKAGIIAHQLGSDEEVAELFNNLGKGVYFDPGEGHYSDYFERMNRYCRTKPNKWKADLNRRYCYNPWTIISLLAALGLLVLTGLQTFYTVVGYYDLRSI